MRYFLFFYLLLTCFGITCASNPLQTQLRAAKHDSTRLRLYTKLAQEYRYKRNFDSSLLYVQLGVELAKKLNSTRYSCDLYICKAYYFRAKKQYNEAIQMAQSAIDFGKANKQYAEAERARYMLAVIYADQAYNTGSKQKQVTAIRLVFENIQFSNQYQSFTQIDNNYNLLCSIYKDNGNDSLAYLYMEKGLKYIKNPGKGRLQLFFLTNNFEIHLYHKRNAEAKTFLAQLLDLTPQKEDVELYLYILSEATKACIKFGEFEQAFSIIQKIQHNAQLMSEMGDERKMLFNSERTTIYLHKINYRLAQQAHEQALFFSKTIQQLAFGDRLRLLINQQKLFEHQKRFEEALALNKRIHTMQDSLASARYSFELAASEKRLDHQNKERFFQQQLKIQQLENQRKTQRLKSAQQMQWVAALVVLLLLVVITIIALQMRKIIKQSNTLKKLNEAKNQLFAIIGHDLRSPILALQGSLERLSPSNTEIQKQLPRINNLLLTTDNLLYWAESQQNSAKYHPQDIALSEIIAEVLALLDASIEAAQLHIQNQVPDTTVVKADENHLRIIIRNVVQNAIKFTPAGGSITFNTQQLSQSVQLTIEDTGIGFEQSQKTTSKRSTQLGLRLVRNLLTLNGGAFSIQNNNQQGTFVSITLPISPNMS